MSEEKFKPHTISLGQTQTESLLQTPATNTNFGENENNNKQSKILVPVSPSVIQNVNEYQVVAIQSALRAYLARKQFAHFKKMIHFRNKVVAEIVTSEENYVHNLRVLVGVYVNPLRSAASSMTPILTNEEVNRIFANVEVILKLSEELLVSLKERLNNWNNQQQIGDVFLKFVSFFKIYSHYTENYERSVEFIKEKTKENPQFVTFLDTTYSIIDKETSEDPGGGKLDLTLSSFLIMPIQRIPRYILLLQEMKKFTWPHHPDFQNLDTALKRFTDVANHVNETMRQADRMNQLLRIEQGFGFTLNLIDPARKFIREGVLTKITSRFIVETYFFLFNDILIYAYRSHIRGLYTFKGKILMGTTWIRDLPDTPVLKNAFQIVATKKTYTVAAATPQLKKEWITDLNKVIEELVAKDPSLIEQRSTQIQTTKRVTGFFWSLFTLSPEQYDAAQKLQDEKEKERKILEEEQKNREEVLRSLSKSPRMRVFSLRSLDKDQNNSNSTVASQRDNDTNSDSTSKLSSPRPQSSPTLQLSQNLQTNEESQHQILKSSSQTLSDTTSSNDVPVYPLKTQLKTPLLSSNTSTKTKYIFDDHEIRESEQDSKCTCCTIV